MDGLLNLRVDANHLVIELGVIADHDFGVPGGGNEDGVDAARNRGGKDVGDLEADEEGEGDDDGSVVASPVVDGVGEGDVEIGEEGRGVADKGGAEGEHGADETVLQRGQRGQQICTEKKKKRRKKEKKKKRKKKRKQTKNSH